MIHQMFYATRKGHENFMKIFATEIRVCNFNVIRIGSIKAIRKQRNINSSFYFSHVIAAHYIAEVKNKCSVNGWR